MAVVVEDESEEEGLQRGGNGVVFWVWWWWGKGKSVIQNLWITNSIHFMPVILLQDSNS